MEGAPRRKLMKRREVEFNARYLTFSCNGRLPLLGTPALRDLFERCLIQAREKCRFRLIAWVAMPEHVHLILVPDARIADGAAVCKAIKQPVAYVAIQRWRRLGAPVLARITLPNGRTRFWQAGGGFDRNVRSRSSLIREIGYIHQNPVKRGLAAHPTEWRWSSSRWYAGMRDGQAPIDVNDHVLINAAARMIEGPQTDASH